MTIKVNQIVREACREGRIGEHLHKHTKAVQLLTLALTQMSVYSSISNIGIFIGKDVQEDIWVATCWWMVGWLRLSLSREVMNNFARDESQYFLSHAHSGSWNSSLPYQWGDSFPEKHPRLTCHPVLTGLVFRCSLKFFSIFWHRKKDKTLKTCFPPAGRFSLKEGKGAMFQSGRGLNDFTCNSVQISRRFPLLSALIMFLTLFLFLAQIWLWFHLFLSFWQTTELLLQSHKSSQVWYTMEI